MANLSAQRLRLHGIPIPLDRQKRLSLPPDTAPHVPSGVCHCPKTHLRQTGTSALRVCCAQASDGISHSQEQSDDYPITSFSAVHHPEPDQHYRRVCPDAAVDDRHEPGPGHFICLYRGFRLGCRLHPDIIRRPHQRRPGALECQPQLRTPMPIMGLRTRLLHRVRHRG